MRPVSSTVSSPAAVCLHLSLAISRTRTVAEIYEIALDLLRDSLGVERASILLFDADGVMRFKAYRGLSEAYRCAVEGHTPWRPDTPDPQPIVVADVNTDASLRPYLTTIQRERIAALAFVPLVSRGQVIGKFMLYYDTPRTLSDDELQLAGLIASLVAFAVERTRAEEQARRSEERLRFALDAASMGTWDWDLTTNQVTWSDNLAALHGLPDATFDGTFASYEREIHPDDRERVLESARRAIAEGVPHDVEYRIVAPDGTVRWVEGKGRVEFENGRPVRMSGVCVMATRRKEAELARLAVVEEASRLKDEFLATLSHELRTPLNAILGWVQMLRACELPGDRAAQAIATIGRNAALQGRLIEDILDVSRIVGGKLDIDREPVHLLPLIDSLLADLMPLAQAKQLRMTHDLPDHLPPIEGDPKRLHQVLVNVLSNAIKFTPEGGSIHVRCKLADDQIGIDVLDSGIGVPREFLPFVFDRFRQADSRSTRSHGGLGLGLAIARHLVELHGGTIAAQSAGPGRGTSLSIRLPLLHSVRVPLPADAPPTLETLTSFRFDGTSIIVVDDQIDSRELLAALFENCGAQVVRCDCAEAALAAVEANGAELLVADIAMPRVDGYELIRRIRDRGERIPAVAVSAYARPYDRAKALASGFDGYCAKPIEAVQFLRTVQQVLASSVSR
jgi:PAS domain S-box-containing protein